MNSFIFKLAASVDNPKLLRLGEFVVHVKAAVSGETREFTFAGEDGYVRVLGNGNFLAPVVSGVIGAYGNEVAIPTTRTGRTVAFKEGEYDIAVGNKYALKTINVFSASPSISFIIEDLNEILYSEQLIGVECAYSKTNTPFNIEALAKYKASFKALSLAYFGDNITGSINIFHDFSSNFKLLQLTNCINVTGSRSTLPSSLTTIGLTGTSVTD